MTTSQQPRVSRWSRGLDHPLGHFVMAALCTIVPLALTLAVVSATLPKPLRVAWPQWLAALLCALGYGFYVRRFERRPVAEFAAAGAVREIASGLALGAVLCLATFGRARGAGCGGSDRRLHGRASVLAGHRPAFRLVLSLRRGVFGGGFRPRGQGLDPGFAGRPHLVERWALRCRGVGGRAAGLGFGERGAFEGGSPSRPVPSGPTFMSSAESQWFTCG